MCLSGGTEECDCGMQRWETEALGDANMRTLQKGDIIQLMRRGYFIVDAPAVRPGKPMVLLSIPDGRSKAPAKPAAAKATPSSSAKVCEHLP